jgi:DnaK suppressor protein
MSDTHTLDASTRAEIASLLHTRRVELASMIDLFDPSAGDAGGPLEFVQIERSRAHLERLRTQLEDVQVALARLADSSYGRCEACNDGIPVERLRALPEATRCRNCAR